MDKKAQVLVEFEELSKIPRYSYYNDKIIAYCMDWAEKNGFEHFLDLSSGNGNVIIRKPAAPGKEDHPAIALQGHLDMVPVTAPGFSHDWDNDPLDLYVDGDFLKARGTTLGADNGVAAAIGFALLKEENLSNPPLELMLTTDEETGMESVKDANLSYLKAKYILNIDGGPEGVFTVGCAGGATVMANIDNNREPYAGRAYDIVIEGLKGGHSGIEINRERGNALKLMGIVLYRIGKEMDYRISIIESPGKDNAIQNKAVATIITGADKEKLQRIVDEADAEFKKEYRLTDPGVKVYLKGSEAQDALCREESKAMEFLLHQLPYGLAHREQNDLISSETSSNIGLVINDPDRIRIVVSNRSSIPERKAEVIERIEELCSIVGAKMDDDGKAYPAWFPNYDSLLNGIVADVYEKMTGKKAEFGTTHGGLECGYILNYSNADAIISMGPTSFGEHSPEEKLSISSFIRTYDLVKAIVETI